MRAWKKDQLLLGSVMHVRGTILILVFSALISGATASLSQAADTIFDEQPFRMNCADRPAPLPPGTHSFMTFSPRAPFARTRLDTLELPLYQVPSLTIAAEPMNRIQIAAGSQDSWTFHFCRWEKAKRLTKPTAFCRKSRCSARAAFSL